MKSQLRTLFILLLCGSFVSMQDPSREYQIKAAFLYNFTQFVEWQPSQFAVVNSPLVVGILGKDPFGSTIDDLMNGESVNGRPIVVRRYRDAGEVKNCHLLFVKSDKTGLSETLQKLKGKSILTVGESPDFLKAGGMIRLYKKEDKVKIQINLQSVKSEKLSISSKLLQLAEIVNLK